MKRLIILILSNVVIWNMVAQTTDTNSKDSLIAKSFEAKLCGIVIFPKPNFNQMCWPKGWQVSSILLYNNELVSDKYLVYNGFENSFIWTEPTETWILRLEPDLVKEVKMRNVENLDSLLFRKTKLKKGLIGDSIDIFFNVMIEGKISLYVYRKMIWDDYNKVYIPDFQYYLKKPDEQLYHFKPRKSSFLSQFPDNKKQLKQIIKKNKLRIKNEADLVKAISLLNSII